MANSEKISEIIDEAAFKQIERLSSLLVTAQGQLASTAAEAKKLNDAFGNSKSMKDFEESQKASAKAMQDVSASQEAANKKQSEYKAKVDETVAATKAKITTTLEEKKVSDQLIGSLDAQIRQQLNLKLQLKAVQEQQKELTKAAVGSKQSKQALAASTAALAKEEAILKAAIQQSNLDIRRSVKENNAAEGSSDALAVKLDQLRASYRGLSETERENEKVGGVLLKQITEYDGKLKELDKSQGVHNREVGNYKLALDGVKKSFTDLVPGASGLVQSFEQGKSAISSAATVLQTYIVGSEAATVSTTGLSGAQYAATVASNGLSVGLKVLRIALISTGIGAIVVLLGSLIAYFASTQEGIDKVTSVTRPLVAIFQSLLGLLQNLGKSFVDAFSSPEKALKSLLSFIEGQVMNRIGALGKIWKAFLDRDFNGVNKGIMDFATGIENVADKTEKFLKNAAAKGTQIDAIQKQIEKNQLAFNRNQIKYNDLVDEQLLKSKDTSLSFAERKKASEEIIRLRQKEGNEEANIIKLKMQKLTIEQGLNDTNRKGNQEMIDLEIALDAAQDKGLDAEKEQIRVISGARKEENAKRLAQIKAEKDAEIALAEKRLELELLIGNASATNSKRIADDATKSEDDRINGLEAYLSEKQRLNELEFKAEQEKIKGSEIGQKQKDVELLISKEKYSQKVKALDEEASSTALKIFTDQLSAEDSARLAANKNRLNAIDIQRDAELQKINERFASGELSQKEYEAAKLEVTRKYNQLAIDEEIKQTEALIELQKSRGLDIGDAEAKLAALKVKYSKDVTDKQIEDLKKVEDAEKKLGELKKELGQEIANLGIQLVNQAFDNQIEKIQLEQDAVSQKADLERQRVEESVLSEDEKSVKLAQINDREQAQKEALAEKERQVKVKQARFQKSLDIAQILTSTGLAIVKQLAATPLPFGLPFISTIGAIGAAQLAAVIATKIPAFEDGGKMKQSGLALFGEVGSELRIEPSGQMSLTPNTPTIGHVKGGTQFISHKDLIQMIAKPDKVNYSGGQKISMDEVIRAVNNGSDKTARALSKLPPSTQITKAGWKRTNNKISNWNNYISDAT